MSFRLIQSARWTVYLCSGVFLAGCGDAQIGAGSTKSKWGGADLPGEGSSTATTPLDTSGVDGSTDPLEAGGIGAAPADSTVPSSQTSGTEAPPSDTAPAVTDATSTVDTPVTAACTGNEAPLFRVIPRLNRAEYGNTVRDLLGHTARLPAATLTADSGDGGFDNNSAALNVSSALVNDYSTLATALADEVVASHTGLVYVCDTEEAACAEEIATELATRAFRRPLEAGEADALVGIHQVALDGGLTFDDGIRAVVRAVLLSPNFIYRPEIDETPDSATPRVLTGSEVASRLSYFVWSSMPDAALTAAAASGDLATAAGVETQIARMLADTKADDGLYSRFAALWFQTDDIEVRGAPDADVYPEYGAGLQVAMQTETRLFMQELLSTDVDFLDYLDAKFTYLNDELAEHYGIRGDFDSEFQRVDLAGDERGGLLRHASVLTTSTLPTRSSPTFRGAYVMARVLGTPPPPPPDDIEIPELVEGDEGGGGSAEGLTVREKLARHREDPQCAACHNAMDPLGFGLENYDGIGRYRTEEISGLEIDTSGKLSTGGEFTGATEMVALLKANPNTAKSVVTHLLSYALGRGLSPDDKCLVDSLTDAFVTSDGHRISSLIPRVATSDALKRRVGAP